MNHAPGWKYGGANRNQHQNGGHGDERCGIERAGVVEQSRQDSGSGQGEGESYRDARAGHSQTILQDHANQVPAACSQRGPEAELLHTLCGVVREQAGDPEDRQ